MLGLLELEELPELLIKELYDMLCFWSDIFLGASSRRVRIADVVRRLV